MGVNAHTDPHMQHRFRADTNEHKLTVQYDGGPYLHLSARKPDTGMYGFDIVTFPGSLVIRGDMGTYIFTRETNMLGFFDDGLDPQQPITINPGYWAEKTPTRGINDDTIARRSGDLLMKQLHGSIAEHAEGLDTDDGADFYRAVADTLFELIDDPDDLDDTLRTIMRFEYRNDQLFADAYEWDIAEYTAQYEWCCYAIVWAIRTYREQQAQIAEAAVTAPADDEVFARHPLLAAGKSETVDPLPESYGCPTAIEQTELRRAARETAAGSSLTVPHGAEYDVMPNTQAQ